VTTATASAVRTAAHRIITAPSRSAPAKRNSAHPDAPELMPLGPCRDCRHSGAVARH
jgi:hypothetical protein